jgi:capsular exopolysaccharide synthesis family protein
MFEADARTAEAYRSIRSSILLCSSQRSGLRRLVFTSAGASEGRTSVVANLGAAFASAQRRVLLVDGDLRNPALHKIFGADNDHGLTDLLSQQIAANPVPFPKVIRETQIPDLYLLSAGEAGARAPEILSSSQLPQLIREFANAFDIVLIDSPPILPYADARSLARAADAVVLIVRAGATARRSALLARDAICQDGAPIVGTILTDWNATREALV